MFPKKCIACCVLILGFCRLVQGQESAALTADDEKALQLLFRDFLFDPIGAERVDVLVRVRTVWGHAGDTKVQGWLVKHKEGDRVYFTDGASVPASGQRLGAKVDFVAECKKHYATAPKKADPNNPRERFARMERSACRTNCT